MSNRTAFFTWLGEAAKYGPALQEYEKLENEIKLLSGYNLRELRCLFAKGFTLKKPNYDLTLSDIVEIINEHG